ncbi:MAG: glycerol-3-phosphate dehydrogenase/oxidase [Gemmataceae bacterium]
MNRADMLDRALARREPWDFVIIGGGATGVGVAVDAASRGYAVLLLERGDFGQGTSSRSTKLVHGGVRYLAQGHLPLVFEALHERGRLRRNAPHLVHDLEFVVPAYSWWAKPFYGVGMKVYDRLAGRLRFGPSEFLSKDEALRRVPTLRAEGLRGGVAYHDGQFDDSRLLIHLARTAATHGAVLVNYACVTGLTPGGVVAEDVEGGREIRASAKVIVNAAGVFCDEVRHLRDPAAGPMVAPSQGSHLVFDRSFLPCDSALVVPKTPDGRVLFAIPWHGHTLVGTTDVAIAAVPREPTPTAAEIEFILETVGRYLTKPPRRSDVLSAFAGVRPLVKAGTGSNTAALSRDHTIRVEGPGLVTITGGKWTTYRAMAEDCVNRAAELAGLPRRECVTADMPIDATLPDRPASAEPLHPALSYTAADVTWAARHEMARTVEDVLARRTRALFLNAAAAVAMAPRAAELLAAELGRDAAWTTGQVQAFEVLAKGYRVV